MKLHLLSRKNLKGEGFSIEKNISSNFLKIWHYHLEFELVVIIQSRGVRFVGDNVEEFHPGEVVLIGSNLPHLWLNSKNYFIESSNLMAESLSIHFRDDFMGEKLIQTLAMKDFLELFKRARQGIKFLNLGFPIILEIENLIKEKSYFKRLIQFMQLLYKLAEHKDFVLLSKATAKEINPFTQGKKFNKVYDYIANNFNNLIKPVRLSDVAKIAKMNTSGYSRFFKKTNRKNFSLYINEMRISYACKLLVGKKHKIISVCYESGFNNLSNFNKQFKKIVGMNPSQFIRLID